ncbi:hypothetical protein AZE42_12481 [Rhizopogon vesiculosus]|uniref:Uncharacterized protein n=1 Tax=Rhizopogon vesiculosus TaxID=180088 RepID=A0A1J8Q459_9AGAM|nr:hypothetical protein AZE42_12481 [Rhizopogon vesiculosus]
MFLREGQANDTLHAIRVNLAHKAVIFHKMVRAAKSQVGTTRAWTQVCSVENVISYKACIYAKCCKQLGKLGADQQLEKYLKLEKGDLKASTAITDPNSRGQRNSTLPWFWSLGVKADTCSSDWMTEFYQVHWLHTKAIRDRWDEEVILMETAEANMSNADGNATLYKWKGYKCYAARQAHVYHRLANHTQSTFQQLKANGPME